MSFSYKIRDDTWNKDFEAELYIGRAFTENAEEFSNFVYKTIAYEQKVLNPGVYRSSDVFKFIYECF